MKKLDLREYRKEMEEMTEKEEVKVISTEKVKRMCKSGSEDCECKQFTWDKTIPHRRDFFRSTLKVSE